LVYDAGQDSEANQELIETSPLHFVGSLPPSDHPALLTVSRRRYRSVDAERFPGLSAFEARAVVFGRDRRVVITHSQNLHDKQRRGFEQTLTKARRQLGELTARPCRVACTYSANTTALVVTAIAAIRRRARPRRASCIRPRGW